MAPEELPDRKHLGHLLWEVGSRVSLLSEAALARTPLTPRAAGMLEAIASDPGTSFAEVSRRLPVPPQAVPTFGTRLLLVAGRGVSARAVARLSRTSQIRGRGRHCRG